ncbi:uncharacterized protein SAPINGB_P002765 [Magnusiomyces paraingens]|uniref:Uncharacterized protein n=1 Tax=Magnusiomyces paraingens TaxID=2606893 RepID=A0A5E8BNU8_9ASCO|nr:uncharacterized protein SAPINGB_P002765 [Saprochaete ingens]VVT50443.1 unnamed protein product [Saprochaete ingens]
MAPPVPVYTSKDLASLHKFPINPETNQPDCPLKELTQYECEVYGQEIICVPFKRLFRACKTRSSTHETLIEVTAKDTNIQVDFEKLHESPILSSLKRKQ